MPRWEPIQYAQGYTLALYCDQNRGVLHNNDAKREFAGETFSDCAREARKAGWKIHRRTRTATCPQCVKLKNGK